MAAARPLRDVFNELAGTPAESGAGGTDPQGVLAAAGHPDLPEGLVAEAIVSYADTAPAEVAEHLAPFVAAHSAVPADPDDLAAVEPASWLDVLTSAPGDLDVDPGLAEFGDDVPDHDPFALDFGDGSGHLDHLSDLDEAHPDVLDHGVPDHGVPNHGVPDHGVAPHGAAGFGGGATPDAGHDDLAGHETPVHPYAEPSFDGLAALDGLDHLDHVDTQEPPDTAEPLDGGVAGPADHTGHDAAGPDSVDGDPADAG